MSGKEPKYQIVMDWITKGIAEGRLEPGDRLISEEKMSQKFGLCRQTIRHATTELVNQDILVRLQGSGTYVGNKGTVKKKERYKTVYVVCTFYCSYIFPSILKGIESTLSEAGYTMQVAFTDNRVNNETNILKKIIENHNIDALILEPSESVHSNPNVPYFKSLQELDVPILLFNDSYPFLDIPCVRLDDRKIAYKATMYLKELGHQKVAGIFKLDDGQGLRRYNGYIDALQEAGLQSNPRNVIWFDSCAESELNKIQDYIFERIEGCSAVVCYNDEIAVQLISLAIKRGLRVPDDLSVISMDDSDICNISEVPITSYPHPKEQLGKKVANNIMQMIENPNFDGNYIFDADVTLRSSVQRNE